MIWLEQELLPPDLEYCFPSAAGSAEDSWPTSLRMAMLEGPLRTHMGVTCIEEKSECTVTMHAGRAQAVSLEREDSKDTGSSSSKVNREISR